MLKISWFHIFVEYEIKTHVATYVLTQNAELARNETELAKKTIELF